MPTNVLFMQERDIIIGLKEGNNIAYKILYKNHYGALCLYATEIVKDKNEAESIVNEVMISIWKNRKNIQIDNLRNYLIRAVKNRCINHIHFQKKKTSNLDNYQKANKDEILSLEKEISNSPLENILMKELDLKIHKSLNQLSNQTKEIFLLSREADLKYQNIADQLNISVDVVKYHIKKALERLRHDLKEYISKK